VWNNDRFQLVMCVDISSRVIWSVNITLCSGSSSCEICGKWIWLPSYVLML